LQRTSKSTQNQTWFTDRQTVEKQEQEHEGQQQRPSDCNKDCNFYREQQKAKQKMANDSLQRGNSKGIRKRQMQRQGRRSRRGTKTEDGEREREREY
jgi:hypothetical protein